VTTTVAAPAACVGTLQVIVPSPLFTRLVHAFPPTVAEIVTPSVGAGSPEHVMTRPVFAIVAGPWFGVIAATMGCARYLNDWGDDVPLVVVTVHAKTPAACALVTIAAFVDGVIGSRVTAPSVLVIPMRKLSPVITTVVPPLLVPAVGVTVRMTGWFVPPPLPPAPNVSALA
jgi:hypothetical protein